MPQTSNNRNNEIVNLKLTIGQCKLIERLVDAELYQAEASTSEFEENALKRVIDVFFAITKESDAEKAARFENWAAPHRPKLVQHG